MVIDKSIFAKVADAIKHPENTTGLCTRDMLEAAKRNSNAVMTSQKLRKLLSSGRTFDLVIHGWFLDDYHLGIAGHFHCPSVILSTMPAIKLAMDLTGNPLEFPHIPNMVEVSQTDEMGFLVRLKRFILYAVENVRMWLIERYVYRPQYEQHFPKIKGYPTFDEVKDNVSVVLVNHHFSQGEVRAYVPSLVPVAGIQMKNIPDPLPKVKYSY